MTDLLWIGLAFALGAACGAWVTVRGYTRILRQWEQYGEATKAALWTQREAEPSARVESALILHPDGAHLPRRAAPVDPDRVVH